MLLDSQLYKINLNIYYRDFLITTLIFILSFISLFYTNNLVLLGLVELVASISLYRTGAFIHEISHQYNKRKFKLFKRIWDLTIGLFILHPSIRFKQPHLEHHKIGVFGTKQDLQYIPLKNNLINCIRIFLILPFFAPIQNLLLVLLSPFKFIAPIKFIYSFIENLIYSIKFTPTERSKLNNLELYYFIVVVSSLFFFNIKIYLFWYLILVLSWSLSTIRIPLEHSLDKHHIKSDKDTQLIDSYTFESIPILAFILQPLGLRYHTAHHLYPTVPYHNLKRLHEQLKIELGNKYINMIF